MRRQARGAGADVLIISADKDLMQLVEPGVSMYDPASGDPTKAGSRGERMIGLEEVVDYFGVHAGQGRSTSRRWRAIRPTTCRVRPASASRPPRS